MGIMNKNQDSSHRFLLFSSSEFWNLLESYSSLSTHLQYLINFILDLLFVSSLVAKLETSTMVENTRFHDFRRMEESIREILNKINLQETNIIALRVQQGQIIA